MKFILAVFIIGSFFLGAEKSQAVTGVCSTNECVAPPTPPTPMPPGPPSWIDDPYNCFFSAETCDRYPPPVEQDPPNVQKRKKNIEEAGRRLKNTLCWRRFANGIRGDLGDPAQLLTAYNVPGTGNRIHDVTVSQFPACNDVWAFTGDPDSVPNSVLDDVYICPSFYELEENFRTVLLMHEFGHVTQALGPDFRLKTCQLMFLWSRDFDACFLTSEDKFTGYTTEACPKGDVLAFDLSFRAATIPVSTSTVKKVIIHKTGGLGKLYGSYGNPICPEDTPNDCFSVMTTGSYISFTAVPEPGYKFVSWSGDSGCSSFGTTLVQLNADMECTVTFTTGTTAPTQCIPAGETCGITSTYLSVPNDCSHCCDYNPSDPYSSELFDYGYRLTCNGDQVGSNSVAFELTSNSIYADSFIGVSWANGSTPTTTDFIGLFEVGSTDENFVDYAYMGTCSRTAPTSTSSSGSCKFSSLPAGTYEFRAFHKNHFTRMGTSDQFTVVEPSSSSVVNFSLPSAGGVEGSQTSDIRTFTSGTYTVMVTSKTTVTFKGAAGGGRGNSNSGNQGGSGGGGGAVTTGTTLTLYPSKHYTLVVGAGGGYTGTGNGQATTFVDESNEVTLISLGGGLHGGDVNSTGAGGTVSVGSNGINGSAGGYGGANAGAGLASTGFNNSTGGAAGGGGGAFYDQGDSMGYNGPVGGSSGSTAGGNGTNGNSAYGGRGGNGAGATFSGVSGTYGYGGGGAGGRMGNGQPGADGIAIFVIQEVVE